MTSKDNLANLSPAEKRKLLAELLAKQGGNAPRLFPLASGQKALWLMPLAQHVRHNVFYLTQKV